MDDFTGMKFGRLQVIAIHPLMVKNRSRRLICRCECGNYAVVRKDKLQRKSEATKSCGCLVREIRLRQASLNRTHGMANKIPEYKAWQHIKDRCFNPKDAGYFNYGGRGITMCDKWKQDFLAFFEHVGPRPSSGYSLDRINNDGNYEPGNCRWATRKEQNGNRRKRDRDAVGRFQ